MDSNPFLKQQQKQKSLFREIVEALIVALILNIFIYFFFLISSQVDGVSMNPTLQDKELLFASKIPTWFYNDVSKLKSLKLDYDIGDIVIFSHENILLVKRVVAKEGDTVKISSEGDLFINNRKVYEKYLSPGEKTYLPQRGLRLFSPDTDIIVPMGQYFLLGDNRDNSKDSRFIDIGFVPREKIKGKAFLRFWPIDKISILGKDTNSDKNNSNY